MDAKQINALMSDRLIQNVKDRPEYFITVKPDGLHAYYGGFCVFIVELNLKKKLFSGERKKYLKYVPQDEAGDRLFCSLRSKALSSSAIEEIILDDTMRAALEKTVDNYAYGIKARESAQFKRKPSVLMERITQQRIAKQGIRSKASQYSVFDLEFAVSLSDSKPECDLAAVIWIEGKPVIGFIEYKCTIAALKKDKPQIKATLNKHWIAMREYINNDDLKKRAWCRYTAMVNAGLLECPYYEKLDFYSENICQVESEALFLFVKASDDIKTYVRKRVNELTISENDNAKFAYFDCIEDIVWDYNAFQKREEFIMQLS